MKELDELYSKDSKVPLIDLEVFAKEHIKSLEESKFNKEMARLQTELDQLEQGKYCKKFPPTPVVTTTTAFLSSSKHVISSSRLCRKFKHLEQDDDKNVTACV